MAGAAATGAARSRLAPLNLLPSSSHATNHATGKRRGQADGPAGADSGTPTRRVSESESVAQRTPPGLGGIIMMAPLCTGRPPADAIQQG